MNSNYFLYTGNNLEQFIPGIFNLSQKQTLFDPLWVIVQNHSLQQWIKQKLTFEYGFFGNLFFINQESAREKLLSAFTEKKNNKIIPKESDWQITIFQELDSPDMKSFPILQNHLNDINPEIQKRKKLHLSFQLSELYTSYEKTREEMILSWKQQKLFFPSSTHEEWQMKLWNHILANYPFETYDEKREVIFKTGEIPEKLPKIAIIGSVFLLETNQNFFLYLSKFTEIHHFLFTPCTQYYGDLSKRSKDPDSHVLLSRWGKPGRQIQNYFIDNPPFQETDLFKIPEPDTLLKTLQADILNLNNTYSQPPPSDDSLKIIACAGKQREIEILYNLLLQFLNQDKNLKPDEILCIASNINEYQTIIETVFTETVTTEAGPQIPDLPYHIQGIQLTHASTIVQGFLDLLDIPDTRFERSAIFTVFQNPCFMERFSLAQKEMENFFEQVKELNIKWGINAQYKKEKGFSENAQNTWEKGFIRLFLGLALQPEDLYEGYAPYGDIPFSEMETIKSFLNILKSLFQDLRHLSTWELPPDQWMHYFSILFDAYLTPRKNNPKDALHKKLLFENLQAIASSPKTNKPLLLDFDTIKHILHQKLDKVTFSTGNPEGIKFGSFKTFRGIPAKVIFVLGMNEGSFPAKDFPLSLDLRTLQTKPLDASLRELDLYLFLELLLSAKQKIRIFYQGSDPLTNTILEPASPVKELIEYINTHYLSDADTNPLIEHHPLHGFDPVYFSGTSPHFSFQTEHLKAAAALLKQSLQKQTEKRTSQIEMIFPVPSPKSLKDEQVNVAYEDLRLFLSNPAKSFFKQTLGLSIGLWSDHLKTEEECIELETLEKWKFYSSILFSQVSETALSSHLECFIQQEIAKDRILAGCFSEHEKNILTQTALVLMKKKSSCSLGQLKSRFVLGQDQAIIPSSNHENFPSHKLIPQLTITTSSGITVKLSGTLPPFFENGFLSFSEKNIKGLKRFRDSWLTYLILRAHEKTSLAFEKTNAFIISGQEESKTVTRAFQIQQNEAKEILSHIVDTYFQNQTGVIPVYYECMEHLLQKGITEQLSKKINDAIAYCEYGKEYFKETTNIDQEPLLKFAQIVYGPMIKN